MKTTVRALQDVGNERVRQDLKWGGAGHDDEHTTAEFVQLIEDYAGWARTMAGMQSDGMARKRLVQVAALAVAACEAIDRKSALAHAGGAQSSASHALRGPDGKVVKTALTPNVVLSGASAKDSEAS